MTPAADRPSNPFEPFDRAAIEQSLPERFESRARRYPDRLALVFGSVALSYEALNRAANRIAHVLLERRGAAEEPVALVMRQGAALVAAILGALKAGKIYVPLEAAWPATRLASLIADAGVGLVLVDRRGAEVLSGPIDVDVLEVDQPDVGGPAPDPELGLLPDRGASIYFTSGSTGRPKGVLDTHRTVLHNVMRYTNSLHISRDDRMTLLQSPSFSGAMSSLFGALLNGAASFPFDVPAEGVDRIAPWLRDHAITIYHSVPSLFRAVAGSGVELPALRLIRLEGDRVSVRDVELSRRHFPRALAVNGLGATECGLVRQFFIGADTRLPGPVVPIGDPLPDMEVRLLDDEGREVGPGEVGEIAVRSRYLAAGYWKQPELTAERFRPDPAGAGLRVYRTGDLGRLHRDGWLEHLGRADFSPKFRGTRVDVAEVEAALVSHGAVAEAVVTVREDEPEAARLVAYVVPLPGLRPTVSALRRHLAARLPERAMPSDYVLLESLPHDANGKVDRRALPAPDRRRPELDRPYVAPRTAAEVRLAAIWAAALRRAPVGVEDDFFDLGGDSLGAALIANRVREAFAVDLGVKDVFDAPTVAASARRIVRAAPLSISPRARESSEVSPTLESVLAERAQRHPDAIALVALERPPLTAAALAHEIATLRGTLRALGIGRHGRVAVALPHGPELVVAVAAVAATAIALPLNPAWRRAEIEAYLGAASIDALLLGPEGPEAAREAARTLGIPVIEAHPSPGGPAGTFTLAGSGPRRPVPDVPAQPADLAFVLHTSGTTARPKRVPLTHANVLAGAASLESALDLGAGDRSLAVMPLFHVHGLVVALGSLLTGGSVACPPAFDATKLFEWLAALRPTWYSAVPVVHHAVVTEATLARVRPARGVLRLARSASAPLSSELAAQVEDTLGVPVIEAYGMTEVTHQIASNPLPPRARKPGSVGVPVGAEVAVTDETGMALPTGEVGEILVRAPGLTNGYEGDPEATAAAFRDGWLRTGDLGRLDGDGYLFITGRVKELINRGGEKIAPREIEEALARHPAVADSVVYAAPHPTLGEDVGAAVVLREGCSVSERDIRDFLDTRLASMKLPARIHFLSELPRAASGKVNRRQLAAVLESGAQPAATPSRPATPIESAIASIWSRVLGRATVGVEDDFFALGGDSLRATMIVSRIRGALGVDLPIAALFERRTVRELAAAVSDGGHARGIETIDVSAEVPTYPVSFAQQRLWFLDQLTPGSPTYNVPLAIRLRGDLDADALRRSLEAVVARHEPLRTRLVAERGEPAQVIAPPAPVPLPFVDLRALEEPARTLDLDRRILEEARRPFDLSRDLMLRATLFRLGETDHVLLLVAHHVATDGWSNGLLLEEVSTLYTAHRQGLPVRLPELRVHYRDYALWQRRRPREEVQGQLEWWQQSLEGVPPVLDLPSDRPRPAVQTFTGGRQARLLTVPPERLRSLCRTAAVSPFMIMLAGFLALLHRYTGREDLVVGTPVAGRGRLEIEPLIGLFVNTLVLRTNLGDDPSFSELLGRVRQVVLGGQAHQELPFEKLVESLDPGRSLSHMPLVQVTFALDTDATARLRLPGLRAESVSVSPGTARFDLSMTVLEREDGYTATVEYSSDLFLPDTIARFLDHYGTLLAAAIDAPACRLSSLPVLDAVERRRLLVDWNATARPFPHDRAIPELFARQAAAQPQAVAVADDDGVLTYAELDRLGNRLAHHLRRLGVGPDGAVGVCLERSTDAVVACLGILKAGGAYVPLDPAHPRSRLAFMLEEARALALVTRQDLLRIAPVGMRTVCLDADAAALAAEPDHDPRTAVTGEHLAYVMFTSGSTGRPKGVAVPHRAVARLVINTDYVSLGPSDVVAQVANLAFDASTFELWGALLNGARVQILPTEALLAPAVLAARLTRHGVTTLFLTTAVFNQMARDIPGALGELRHLLFGGETADPRAAARLLEHGFAGRLLHVYGPTEATTFAAWDEVVDVPPGATTLPIGRPIANTRVYLLDTRANPVPIGVAGEIYIGGPGVARGYVNRPDLTGERFVPDPFGHEPGARLYRSGDLGRYLPDGRIDFLGRFDEQVKIRGHRIEPAEVEAALATHPGVRDAVVVVREFPEQGKLLVAYVVPVRERSVGADELKAALSEHLPPYMLPAAFLMVDGLPLTPNGKVDRSALPSPARETFLRSRSSIAPRTPTEEVLAQIWADVLGIERVGVESGFFDLGGHSLLATRVLSRIRAVLDVDLPVRALFEGPTVAELARRVDEARAQRPASTASGIPRGERKGELPLSFSQLRFWLLQQLSPETVLFNVSLAWRLRGPLDEPALRASLQALVDRHEVLRTRFALGAAGEPVQRVAPATPVHLAVADISDLPVAEREKAARRLATESRARAFDLARGPLFRPLLVRLDTLDHVLLLATHHIAVDGWSFDVLRADLARAYGAIRAGGRAELPELPVRYGDFVLWQRERLERGELDAQLAYWRQQLSGPLPELLLPTDRSRPLSKTYRGARVSVLLPPALAGALRQLGVREGASLFMVLLAAVQVLLHRYSGEDDVVVGAPADGHRRAEVEGLAGCFLNLVAFRTNLGGNPSFREALARARRVALGAYGHQDVPFEKVLEVLYPDRVRTRTPIFQVLLNMHEFDERLLLPGLVVEPFEIPPAESLFDLTLYFRTEPTGIRLTAAYDTDLFVEARITDLLAQLAHLLEQAAADPERRIDELSLLTHGARTVLPDATASLDAGWKGSVPDRLTFHARGAPERLAIDAGPERWTYGELERRSNQLAHALRAAGLVAEDVLAIYAHRSAPLVWAILGALKAGIAYMILDPAYPERRLVEYVEMARPRAWIEVHGAPPMPERLEATAQAAAWRGRLGPGPAAAILRGPALDERASSPPIVEIGPNTLAFIQFTSGSTGRPRGVMGRHGPLSHFLPWQAEAFGLSAADRFSMASGLSHDPLQRDIFTPLWVGGSVCIPDPGRMAAPGWLATWMGASDITVAMLTPAMAQLMAAAPDTVPPRGLVPSLRCVFLVGEALRRRDVSNLRRLAPATEVVNLYGSTETQRAVGYVVVNREGSALWKEIIPLGRGMPDVQLLVLGPAGQPAGIGELGEVFVRSPHLARGYLGEPALTAERFVVNPATGQADDRLYRTGDLGRYLPDGTVEFAGRRDNQVKLRGFRIELSEIEGVLGQHRAVRETVVVARADGEGGTELVAYVVPHEPAPTVAELRRHTRDRLPDYMVPARWVVVAALPLTPNGKVDRAALPTPDRGRPEHEAPYTAPRTAIEARVAAIWGEVLGRDQVGAEDDFFDLGGDSLRATMVVARLQDAFGADLSLVALFERRTVAELAVVIAESAALPERPRTGGGLASGR